LLSSGGVKWKSIHLSMVNWWNDTDKESPKSTEETMAMPLCPTKTPQGLASDRTQVPLMTGW